LLQVLAIEIILKATIFVKKKKTTEYIILSQNDFEIFHSKDRKR